MYIERTEIHFDIYIRCFLEESSWSPSSFSFPPSNPFATSNNATRYSLETEENGSRLVIRGTVRGDGGEFSCQVRMVMVFMMVVYMMVMVMVVMMMVVVRFNGGDDDDEDGDDDDDDHGTS